MKGLDDVWKWRLTHGTGKNVEPMHVQCDVELTASSVIDLPIKSVILSILLFHGKCDWNNDVIGSWHVAWNDLNGYPVHACAIQMTTTIDHIDNKTTQPMHHGVYGLAQDCSDSSALAMELLQSCAKPSMSSGARGFVKWSAGQTKNEFYLWNYGDKYEKPC